MAASFPIASHVGAIAVPITSAPRENSRANKIQPAKLSQIVRSSSDLDFRNAFCSERKVASRAATATIRIASPSTTSSIHCAMDWKRAWSIERH